MDSKLLVTDKYQMTMSECIHDTRFWDTKATFDVFYRKYPWNGGYSVFCGLDSICDYISNQFYLSNSDKEYLLSIGYSKTFISKLESLFPLKENDIQIYSFPEGSVVFPKEPIFRITAKIPLLFLLETSILNMINHESLIATKASRIVEASKNKSIIEFGLRRAHGFDAGINGAKAAYIGGCLGTSNMYTGKKYHIPIFGTCDHAWVMMFNNEYEAFETFAEKNENNVILIIDTYDTIKSGIVNAIKVFNKISTTRNIHKINYGVRLDSGDLVYLSKVCRKMLDTAGFTDAKIMATNDLDEYIISDMDRVQGSQVDTYGVGTSLITAKGNSAFGAVYKMSAVQNEDGCFRNVMKLSDNIDKMTLPGVKQVNRIIQHKKYMADLISFDNEIYTNETDLTIFSPTEPNKTMKFEAFSYDITTCLNPVYWHKHTQTMGVTNTATARSIRKTDMDCLWDSYKRIHNPDIYKVDLSESLYNMQKQMIESHKK